MKQYSATEVDLLDAASFDGCVADADGICEPFTADEMTVLDELQQRGLVAHYLCSNCLELAARYGTDPDDDFIHFRLTSLGVLALRLARTQVST